MKCDSNAFSLNTWLRAFNEGRDLNAFSLQHVTQMHFCLKNATGFIYSLTNVTQKHFFLRNVTLNAFSPPKRNSNAFFPLEM